MKRILRYIILTLLVCFTFKSEKLQASHLAAVDVFVDYVPTGDNPYRYKVTLYVYKACEGGANLSDEATLTWQSLTGCLPSGDMRVRYSADDTLDKLCDTFKQSNSCRNATSIYPAFQRRTYIYFIDLPGACPDWVFSWREAARNAAIKNITTGNLYGDAMINNTKKARVNTPRYSIDPIPYFCLNSPAIFPNAPKDPDGDLMVTSYLNPRNAGPDPYSYEGYRCPSVVDLYCFSAIDPIASATTDPYYIDPNTGTATFTPTLDGKFVLAFQTFDYDRVTNELMGFTTRDVQVSVLGCASPPPEVDDEPKDMINSYYKEGVIYGCPGSEMVFTIGAESRSSRNKIFTKWDLMEFPTASFTSEGNGSYRTEGTFKWTPTKEDVGRKTLTLRFVDSTCSNGQPLLEDADKVFIVEVLPYVEAGVDGIYCIPGGDGYQMKTVEKEGMRYKWSSISGSSTTPPFMDNDTLARPRVRPSVASSYMVEGSVYIDAYRCATRDTVDVRMGVPSITISAGPDQTVCANRPTSLKASVSPMSQLGLVNWSPSGSLDDSTKLNAIAKVMVTTDFVLYAEDKNGCGFTDTTKLIVDGFYPEIDPRASRDTICSDDVTQLIANVSQQACGIAQNSCNGGIPEDKTIGTGLSSSVFPTPFYHTTNSAGERMQILYTRDELMSMGMKAGFINSLAFNVASKNSTDPFSKFSIKMGCTGDNSLSGSTLSSIPGITEVYHSPAYNTRPGWNVFEFKNSYFWDGRTSLIVEVCWSKEFPVYGGDPDPVFVTSTPNVSVKYIREYTMAGPSMGDGCAITSNNALLSSARPNTRFNICVPSSIFTYSWTPRSSVVNPDSATTFTNRLKDNTTFNVQVYSTSNPTCSNTSSISIYVDRSNSVTALPLSPVVHCRPGYFNDLNAIGNGPRPMRNLMCGESDIKCDGAQSRLIIGNPSTLPVYEVDTAHAFFGFYPTVHTQYIIPRSSLLAGGLGSSTIRGMALETVGTVGTQFRDVKVSISCTELEEFVDATPIMFETGLLEVANVGSLMFDATGYREIPFDKGYNWDTTKNLIIDICYSGITPGSASPILKTYQTPGKNTMIRAYSSTTNENICTNPSAGDEPHALQVLPAFRFTVCPAGDTDFTYTWTPGNYFEDSIRQRPRLNVDSTTTVYVSTKGRSGCTVRDSVTIFVPKNRRYLTMDTAICLKESVLLRSNNGSATKWYEQSADVLYGKSQTLSCDTCDKTIAKPTSTTTYYAAVTDEYGCTDTFKVTVTVNPLPQVNVLNKDTVVKYGSTVNLRAIGGTDYVWSPAAGLSNPSSVNPTATPLVSTTYKVVGVGQNGCKGEDSVRVIVDYKSKVGVPTGFTPNGDGENDKFKLSGITFQTLMEFKVFNRWGQEVFSTTDIKEGWDGRFNGTEQPMGVYNYVIKIGYPDGEAETLKGDVTLIR
jgi:gliding motility-associated-like protein